MTRIGRNPIDYVVAREWLRVRRGYEITKHLLCHLERDCLVGEGGVSSHPGERPLQLSDIGLDAFGDECEDITRNRCRGKLRVASQDREPGFDVRSLNVGEQAPLEAAPETVLESRKVLGMAIRCTGN